MKQLIAVSPILFESVNYEPGDELPTHNAGLVEIRIGNGAAIWQDNEEPKKKPVKGKAQTAPAGLTGRAGAGFSREAAVQERKGSTAGANEGKEEIPCLRRWALRSFCART